MPTAIPTTARGIPIRSMALAKPAMLTMGIIMAISETAKGAVMGFLCSPTKTGTLANGEMGSSTARAHILLRKLISNWSGIGLRATCWRVSGECPMGPSMKEISIITNPMGSGSGIFPMGIRL